jgi:site-specific DNA-cytosine methylase
MKMLDLFCGTKSMSKAFDAAGWETYTVDWDK